MPTLIFNMETKALYEKCKRMMDDLSETTVSMGFASAAPQNAAILTGRGSVGDRKWGKKMLNNNKLIKGRKKPKNSFSNWGTSHDPYKEGENEVDKLLDKFDESYDITVELEERFNAPLGKGSNRDLNRDRVLATRKRKRDLELGRQARLGKMGFNRRLSRKFNKKLGGK